MSGTLLVVNDGEDVLDVMVEYLGALGYRVLPAGSGREAIARIEGPTRFDLAVVDWSLPDLPGRDVVLALRRRQPDCAVIVTSGHAEEGVHDLQARHLGVQLVRKPYALRALALRIGLVLEHARANH